MVGDPDRLQQIVSNLLSNAIKFTPAPGRVAIRLAARGPQFELVVADTGIGIESAFLPHVFEHFRQAAPVTNREQGGLGLGLAITRHLVELHGGTIRVASAGKGAGTTATVVLPASPPVAQATPDAQLGRADRTEGN
jgi:signal transduction histidine kinase